MNFNSAMNNLASGINKHADLIMTIGAVIGLATTVYLAIKATPKAEDVIYDTSHDIDDVKRAEDEGRISHESAEREIRDIKIYSIKKLVRIYAPTAVSAIGTTCLILGSNKISRTRNAALNTALNAANFAYAEYRDRVRSTIGEKKETAIYDEIVQSHIESLPPPTDLSSIVNTGNGNTICRIELVPGNPATGLYFYSSADAVHRARNNVNADGLDNGFIEFRDLLYELGLRKQYKDIDPRIGWEIASRNDLIEFRESSHIHDNGEPVLDIGFYNNPIYI